MTTTTVPATALAAGDAFSRKGSAKRYTVTEVTEAHRAEYSAVVRVTSATGTQATVAFPTDATVELHK